MLLEKFCDTFELPVVEEPVARLNGTRIPTHLLDEILRHTNMKCVVGRAGVDIASY